ncbi:MAG TPA: HDOD domain-containing protein [Candidatus Binatia bacterium]|nr:HDOD domain-containing protein [Candidatus Binatia bacterium]
MHTDRRSTAYERAPWAPSDTSELRRMLESAISNDRLELPLLPGVASEILSLTTEAEVDGRRLVSLLHRDIALAGHVLRIANSPAYLGRTAVTSLQAAVTRLGMTTLGEIALAATLRSGVFHVPGHEETLRGIWREGAAAGVFAREIARRTGRSAESAFLCGFLHAIGKPVVLQAAVRMAPESGRDIPAGEALVLMDELHARAGHAIGRAWSLPEPVAATLAALAGQAHGDDRPEVVVAGLAIACGRRLLAGGGDAEALKVHPACARLGLAPDDVAAILDRDEIVLAVVNALAP